MPGWIIQGVRGEGKSLAAVWMIKKYLSRGCPVATNLDLWLDNLLDAENDTLAYRLPDWPRYEDLIILPDAYDRKYKGEDKNGLLVLDEMALWANTREWNSKGRDKLIKWLLLSRKKHWDLILLCQDAEMIDKQIQKTCCDYLVQASRTDRTKVPYLGAIKEYFFMSPYRKKEHEYNVYYGLTGSDVPSEQWRFEGLDLYDGYDTNQQFEEGTELIGNQIIDFRATYTYLPASYLTKRKYIRELENLIDDIQNTIPLTEGEPMALKPKNTKKDALFMKAALLTVALVVFIGWRFFSGGFSLPGGKEAVQTVAQVATGDTKKPDIIPVSSSNLSPSQAFLDKLLTAYRPRLAAFITGKNKNGDVVTTGLIEFYEGSTMVERFTIAELKTMGCAVISKPYGVDIITSVSSYTVSPWPRPANNQPANPGGVTTPKTDTPA